MKQFIEVTAMRIGAVIQNVCANVEFEVMSLPGGSLIAVLLCLYAIAMSSIRRAATEIRTSGIRPKVRGIVARSLLRASGRYKLRIVLEVALELQEAVIPAIFAIRVLSANIRPGLVRRALSRIAIE